MEMHDKDWDGQIEYLKNTRDYFWNDDYFEFLVHSVWKLNTPINIIDFGCGYGYLGLKLLKLLPEGSSYTGIDIGTDLLTEANRLFQNTSYKYEFVKADLLEYEPYQKYDLAICQAPLRHIPQYEKVLQKMISSVTLGGKVVCVEVNRRLENAGLYIQGYESELHKNDEWLHQRWQHEVDSGGRDYLLGAKIPILMEKYGLIDIAVRVNDYAEYISPKQKDYDLHKLKFLEEHQNILDNKADDVFALNIRSMIITCGTKSQITDENL